MVSFPSMLDIHPLFIPGLFATPIGRLFLAIILIGLVILVGKFVLNVAWKLLVAGAIVIALWFLLTLLPIF